MIRAVLALVSGFKIAKKCVEVLAYTDDLVLITLDPDRMQRMLNVANEIAAQFGLQFGLSRPQHLSPQRIRYPEGKIWSLKSSVCTSRDTHRISRRPDTRRCGQENVSEARTL